MTFIYLNATAIAAATAMSILWYLCMIFFKNIIFLVELPVLGNYYCGATVETLPCLMFWQLFALNMETLSGVLDGLMS